MRKFAVVLVALLFCIGVVHGDTWRELSSLFGVPKPFRQGHAAIMTTFGRMASFSGLDNTLTGSKQVSRYNYLSNSQLQILDDLPVNERASRQLSGYGSYQDRYLVQYGGLVGGQNSKELIIFDVQAGLWRSNISTFLTDPTFNIENHYTFGSESPAAAIDEAGNALWLFGGRSTIFQLNFVTKVDLSNHPNYEFIQINLTSTTDQPERRYASALTFYIDRLYLVGGRKGLGSNPVQDLGYFADTRRFDIGTSTWTSISHANGPSARAYAATCVLKDGTTWVHFGGLNELANPSNPTFADVFKYNLAAETWSGAITVPGDPSAPSGRFKLVGVHLGWAGEDSVLFHGGSDAIGGSLNNFWKLEIVTNNTSPNPPPPDLDQDADVIDPGTTIPPPSSSSVVPSSSEPPLIIEDGAAAALASWLSWFFSTCLGL